jgi:hypothetical protein
MLTITTDIKGRKYEALIEYAYVRCDAFSFRLPHLSGYDGYKERVMPVLEKLRPYVIKQYTGTEYFWSTGVEADIYVVSLAEELKDTLLSHSRLFDWQYPEAPEDLCFISKGKCWLSCIAHEDLCFIYTDCAVEKEIIKKILGLKFTERDDVETPRLK